MYGAIIGDIVGSVYEFNNYRAKDFTLFKPECFFTDDTVMTLAVAKSLLAYERVTDGAAFRKTLIENMHELGNKYILAGYGGRFLSWIMRGLTEPYNSYGNGSAMRVSPVAWYANSLKEAIGLGRATAEVTHSHPEGIKGAESVAGATYLARTGASMDEIRRFVCGYYDMDFTLDEIRDSYMFNETCQDTVPQALQAFFESTSFEDAIRNGISIGGDSDTIGAITGAVAHAYYGMSGEEKEKALSYLDSYLCDAVTEFCQRYGV